MEIWYELCEGMLNKLCWKVGLQVKLDKMTNIHFQNMWNNVTTIFAH